MTGPDRALLATALYVCFGGKGGDLDKYVPLMQPHLAERARIWGLAIRLGHRLSGGTARALQNCPIKLTDDRIILKIPAKYSALDSPAVRGRLAKLADALKLEPVVKVG